MVMSMDMSMTEFTRRCLYVQVRDVYRSLSGTEWKDS